MKTTLTHRRHSSRKDRTLLSRILRRAVLLTCGCLFFAYSGFEASHLRSHLAKDAPEVIAAAGGEPSSLLGPSSSKDGRHQYRLSALSVFSNVALHVKDHYVDPERINPQEMLVRALEEVEQQIAEVLVENLEDGRIRVEVMGKRKIVVNDVESLWEINLKLRDVFRFFEKHLPPQDDVRLIEYAAVNGALSTLDPHSILLKPEAFAEMKTSTKGEFGGLGIVISIREEKLTIISPIDDTPAARAGLKAGDVISRIGEVSTVSMPVDEAVRMLRGPIGSKIVIFVDRTGWDAPRKFSIIRELIKLESVESKLLSSNVGYIKIKNFQQKTGRDLEEHLNRLKKQAGKLSALVLDLRNNPGGLLEQATRVSDKFISSGEIVTTVGYGNKLREPKRARWSGTETDLPIAVLVNRGSASASEIVAGALKNLDRATIIGETTFGKGSVQVLYDFSDNSALKLTIAQYLTPGDISIQNEGVRPDIALRPAWLKEKAVRMFYENEGHRESSLDKHLEKTGKPSRKSTEPTYAFTYLIRETEEDTSSPEVQSELQDFPIKFAHSYLLATHSKRRSVALERGRSLLRKTEASEEDALTQRLAELGVDWSPPPKKASGDRPQLDVQLELVDPVAPGHVRAGSEIAVRARVTNRSHHPLHRLRGTLKSDHSSFEGRELLFGQIPPGEARTWTVYTRVPREESTRTDRVTLTLESPSQKIDDQAEITITTQRVAQPQFAFTWLFDDVERGDGDGLLEIGEGIDMNVLVTNIGEGSAEAVALRLRSAAQEDLFLERGRVQIGTIAPGETRTGTLRFRVPKKQSDRGHLPLEVTVYDSPSGEWLEGKFNLHPTHPSVARARPYSKWTRAKSAVTLLRGAHPSSPVVATIEAGTRLKAEAKIGKFTRVLLPDGSRVFARSKSLTPSKRKGSASSTKITYHSSLKPPHISLGDVPTGDIIRGDGFRLEGSIKSRSLRDMYVLLNGDKVYFDRVPESAKPQPPTPGVKIDGWVPPNEEAVVLPFSVQLDLKETLNKVIVVARVNETVMSHRTLYLSRAATPPTVAKHSAPTSQTNK